MALSSKSLNTGPTLSSTGGTAVAFTSFGSALSGLILGVAADTDQRIRRFIEVNVSRSRVQSGAPNGYTQSRTEIVLKKPKLLANSKYTTNTLRISLSVDPETTDTERNEMLDMGAQMFIDTDFRSALKNQVVS